MIKNIEPALAEGGKIKIGGLGETRTSQGGKEYRLPQKYDHFVITKTTRTPKGDFEIDTELMAALPKDPDGKVRALPIILHSDEIDAVFPTSYAIYRNQKLECRGDGEHATRWKFNGDKRTSETTAMACPCPLLEQNKCKPHGALHCSIAVPGRSVAGSVHRWRTTSLISVQRLIGSMHMILSTVGTMRGLPLWLKLEAVKVAPDGAPASTVYVCHLELRAHDLHAVQMQAIEANQRRLAISGGRFDEAYKALVRAPAGDLETDDDAAEVQQEFHPEGNVIDAVPELTDEQAEQRKLMVQALEEAAGVSRDMFAQTWKAMTAEQRDIVGKDEFTRIKGTAK